MLNFPLFPEQASTYAPRVDLLFWSISAFLFLFVNGLAIVVLYLAIKYRKKPGEDRPSKHYENIKIEIIWSVIPLIIGLIIFAWGAFLYYEYANIPDDTLDINVIGKQWMWKMQHPNGKREVNELHIPSGRPVKLTMTSQDVIHNFFVPAFRVKQDVLPARYTELWFEATKPGTYPLFCAEYCGTNHSTMAGTVTVLEPAKYEEWLSGGPQKSPIEAGEELFTRLGCASCHAAGDESRGPNLENVFGHEQELRDGSVVVANEEYIRESIMNPMAKIVKGYSPIMPSFSGQVNDDDMVNIIAYIKSLSDVEEVKK